MPRQNRVSPLGDLVAHPARGLVYGNRGCLHDDAGRIRRGYATRRWIACRLAFRGWQRGPMMQPGRFTELFFLDEATALAAGHRPCALCRRRDYTRLHGVWRDLHGGDAGADAIDLRLHGERLNHGGRGRRIHAARMGDLPDGTYVLERRVPRLVLGDRLLEWTPAGYGRPVARPAARRAAETITPPSLVELLRRGWDPLVPLLHHSAHGGIAQS